MPSRPPDGGPPPLAGD
ncbi:MAG: hypothetical protein M0P73_19440 [Syntrophobacterales bacterium]|nr:hypothetical protein [Syntrophobacterales bacterium]